MNNISTSILTEPKLLFGNGTSFIDTKTGISLYGPYSNYPKQIQLGIVGDSETVDSVKRIIEICSKKISGSTKHPLWTPDFPGIKSFNSEFVLDEEWYKETITNKEIDDLERIPDYRERISFAVNLFCEKIAKIQEREGSPTLFICAPPKRMMAICIPPSGESNAEKYWKKTKSPNSGANTKLVQAGHHTSQKTLLGFHPDLAKLNEELMERRAADNFHHFLKAKAMKLNAVTQFIRPYTLDKIFSEGKGKMYDLATFCWNFCVALFYKSGGQPWRLESMSAGTCYVGITFYKEKKISGGKMGTSLAQVFTPEGEGLVIRGERFEWENYKEPHLSKETATRLMNKIISAYKSQVGTEPTRVVVHKSSTFNEAEKDGMKEALPSFCKHDFVTILENARKKITFFRQGYNPVIRGTTIILPDNSRLIYTKGYVPFIKLYPGPRVPRPLEVIFSETDSPHDLLCKEIFGLTRMNWNSADFACYLPITLQFSRWVGNILRELPPGTLPASKFLYYM
ncbi:MAG: argonaute/piwi family protein [Candidatus Pacearchaeota archaeon]